MSASISLSFQQDTKLVSHLLAVLTREQADLVHADINSIEALMDEKAEILQAINLSTHVRYDALSKLGLPGNEDGMALWIKKQNNPGLNKAWFDFQNTLLKAKEMNRLNGVLINKHFSRNQQLLTSLHGAYASGGVYGANGQATSQAYTRASLTA